MDLSPEACYIIEMKNESTGERFFRQIKQQGTCWIWTGPKRAKRYGKFFFCGKHMAAHRFSYELYKGPIKPKMYICHTCDNPLCVNPVHLYQGTQTDNMRDCVNRRRNKNISKTHCKRGHLLAGDNLIINTRANGRKYRNCRKCVNAMQRVAYLRDGIFKV